MTKKLQGISTAMESLYAIACINGREIESIFKDKTVEEVLWCLFSGLNEECNTRASSVVETASSRNTRLR